MAIDQVASDDARPCYRTAVSSSARSSGIARSDQATARRRDARAWTSSGGILRELSMLAASYANSDPNLDRPLGAILPYLPWCERFELDVHCDLGRGPATLHLRAPLLLPPSSR